MSEQKDWLDELLEQVADGDMPPQEALERFFLHKRAEGSAVLTEEDNAFISAMDAVETAQAIAGWCARSAEAQGGVIAIEADLRRPTLFHPNRRPPKITGTAASGKRIMLFSADDAAMNDEYAQDCLRAAGSFTGTAADPAFLPVFMSALGAALEKRQLPRPTFLR